MNEQLASRLKNAFIWTSSTLSLSLLLTFFMAEFEKGVNPALREWKDILWWWVVTVAGVGYGDILPITNAGRVLGGLVILSSLFLLAIVVSEISALIKLLYERRDQGIIRIKYTGHIVIYGYTSLTAGVIQVLNMHYKGKMKIVLISNDIQKNPFPGQVDFIYGNPIEESTFREANVKDATAAIVLSNDRFNDPDAYSLVIISGIDKKNSKIITLVELFNDDKKELFKEINIDGFIERNELIRDFIEKEEFPKLIRIINKQTGIVDKENDPSKTMSESNTG